MKHLWFALKPIVFCLLGLVAVLFVPSYIESTYGEKALLLFIFDVAACGSMAFFLLLILLAAWLVFAERWDKWKEKKNEVGK